MASVASTDPKLHEAIRNAAHQGFWDRHYQSDVLRSLVKDMSGEDTNRAVDAFMAKEVVPALTARIMSSGNLGRGSRGVDWYDHNAFVDDMIRDRLPQLVGHMVMAKQGMRRRESREPPPQQMGRSWADVIRGCAPGIHAVRYAGLGVPQVPKTPAAPELTAAGGMTAGGARAAGTARRPMSPGLTQALTPWHGFRSTIRQPYPSAHTQDEHVDHDVLAMLATHGKPNAKPAAFISAGMLGPHGKEVLEHIRELPGYSVREMPDSGDEALGGGVELVAGMTPHVDELHRIYSENPDELTHGHHRRIGHLLGIHPDAVEAFIGRISPEQMGRSWADVCRYAAEGGSPAAPPAAAPAPPLGAAGGWVEGAAPGALAARLARPGVVAAPGHAVGTPAARGDGPAALPEAAGALDAWYEDAREGAAAVAVAVAAAGVGADAAFGDDRAGDGEAAVAGAGGRASGAGRGPGTECGTPARPVARPARQARPARAGEHHPRPIPRPNRPHQGGQNPRHEGARAPHDQHDPGESGGERAAPAQGAA